MNEDELAAFLEGGQDGSGEGPVEDLRALLADESSWAEPPAGGADALLAAIAAERGGSAPGEPDADDPVPERPAGPRARRGASRSPGRRRPPGRRPRALVVAAAAAALVLLAVTGVALLGGGGGGTAREELAIAGTELAPEASAMATTRDLSAGVAIELDLQDLPPAEPGTYYQGWVKGPEGAVTVGTFHARDGDGHVELWSGVGLDRYPTLTVTLQEEGAGAMSSGEVVLSGRVGPDAGD